MVTVDAQNAIGLIAIGSLNAVGFIALGGLNASGVIAIGEERQRPLGPVLHWRRLGAVHALAAPSRCEGDGAV